MAKKSMLRACRGDAAEQLEVLRNNLAARLDACQDEKIYPQLARQFRETVRQLDELGGDDGEDDPIAAIKVSVNAAR